VSASFHEFKRTDEHGITRKEINRLIDDILDYLIEAHEEISAGKVREITVNLTVLKGGRGAE